MQYGQKEGKKSEDDKPLVTIKMVTGDHLHTAKKIALDAGILTKEEFDMEEVAMTGERFREKIGYYEVFSDD
jgi:magnesium-transporting ATPase (P-type)